MTEVVIRAAKAIITKTIDLQARRLPDTDLAITLRKVPITMTCTQMLVCRNGVWVADGTRLTVTRGAERSHGTKKFVALTWSEAQEELAGFARRKFQYPLERELNKMAAFRDECASR